MRTKSLIGPGAVLLVMGSLLAPALLADADAPLAGDVTIASSSPTTNYNTGTPAQTLNIAPGNAGLVQFDLSGISPGTVVNVAYLRVFADKVNAAWNTEFHAGHIAVERKHGYFCNATHHRRLRVRLRES